MTAIQMGLLAAAVAIQLACAVGVLRVHDPFARLHLVSPVSVFGSLLIVVAVVVGGSAATHLAKVVVIGLLLWISGPFVTRATARALRIRSEGRLEVAPGELEAGDG